MAFPSLSRRAIDIETTYENSTIKHSLEAGYEFRRPRFTRDRRSFKVQYDLLKTTDKELLVTHFNSVGTHTSFAWTDLDGISYTVYYGSPLSFNRVMPGWFKVADIILVEV